jgi:quinol-cytochrome oxidoreductase complex cytochrome b subunit
MLAVTLVVLTATGVWLWFRYQPVSNLVTFGRGAPTRPQGWIRETHRVAAWLAAVLAVGVVVLLVVRRVRARASGVVAGIGVLVTSVAALFTGFLLPWDQLALWAVTTGDHIRGAQATFHDEVKYIIVGTREVSPGTYRFWAIAHVVLGVLVGAALVLTWLRTRRASGASGASGARQTGVSTGSIGASSTVTAES